ncbi:MAG: preprotein translocase subunit SecA [Thermodesulfobacteriota bacterium]|nr:preprotein translocase subunit SecA [Thermodesulfobacteriota bacterium]
MIRSISKKIFGSQNDRELKRLQKTVAQINALEEQTKALDDAALQAKTVEFKQRYADGETLDALLPEAFAVVREAAWRVLGMRHFDVQLVGGMVLNGGKIAEMKTGEGKTLVATLATYLNALSGKGVHVITVNDYLASRDSEWMGRLHQFLGLSIGCIVHGISDEERKAAYQADITYGTNNEFGFDYLRDNMKFELSDYVQRELNFAIVDEVDSILIDEARTPLIISGPSEASSGLYYKVDVIIPRLKKGEMIEHRDGKIGQSTREFTGDYTVDEKAKAATLTEDGVASVEKILGIDNLYDPHHIEVLHHVNQALKAHALFKNEVDYVVRDGEVMIVDEFTGRLMPGRRWSDGLHQAVEAKEGVKIESENQTLATITFQNYFRMYDKLAGMTGTADTEAPEFAEIYKLDVVVIPTNKPNKRSDQPDVIYKTEQEKFNAVIEDICQRHGEGQPMLVGTISIENSERLAAQLKKTGVPHHVLNAKHHEKEASIIAQAGRSGSVTIATNMAGRGTDIVLGGNPEMLAKEAVGDDSDDEHYAQLLEKFTGECAIEKEQVIAAGGLYILGTERHESRRIDNQLRGRAGRQGDPGASRFYMSLEDDLLRIFGSQRVAIIMDKLKIPENEPIEHGIISKAIENAQKKVEGHNFDIRKHLIEYDDVMNRQREVIYSQRREVLGGENIRGTYNAVIEEMVEDIVATFCPEKVASADWNIAGLVDDFRSQFNFDPQLPEMEGKGDTSILDEQLKKQVFSRLIEKEAEFTPDVMEHLMMVLLLQVIDSQWKDHLLSIDHLKEGIGLRGYAQKNPKEEYKREAYDLFMQMMGRIRQEVLQKLFMIQLVQDDDVERMEEEQRKRKIVTNRSDEADKPAKPVTRDADKVGRNQPCPCGSGKKYKKCCGK